MDEASVLSQAESINASSGKGGEKNNGFRQGSELVTVANSKGWSSGLFSCHPRTCTTLDEWMCWPCVSCRLAALVGENCLCACRARTRLRSKFGIKGTETEDLCLFAWCGACALNQMLREIEALTDESSSKSDSTSESSVSKSQTDLQHPDETTEAENGNVVTVQPGEQQQHDQLGVTQNV